MISFFVGSELILSIFSTNKLGCYSVQLDSSWEECGRELGLNFFKLIFLYFILKLRTEFQFPIMPATGQKVFGGVVGGLSLL